MKIQISLRAKIQGDDHITAKSFFPMEAITIRRDVDYGITVDEFYDDLVRPLMAAFGYSMTDWELVKGE